METCGAPEVTGPLTEALRLQWAYGHPYTPKVPHARKRDLDIWSYKHAIVFVVVQSGFVAGHASLDRSLAGWWASWSYFESCTSDTNLRYTRGGRRDILELFFFLNIRYKFGVHPLLLGKRKVKSRKVFPCFVLGTRTPFLLFTRPPLTCPGLHPLSYERTYSGSPVRGCIHLEKNPSAVLWIWC